jgi:hypothetical protein
MEGRSDGHDNNGKGEENMSNIHRNPQHAAHQPDVEELSCESLSAVVGGYPEDAPRIALLNRVLADILPDGMIPLPVSQGATPDLPEGGALAATGTNSC